MKRITHKMGRGMTVAFAAAMYLSAPGCHDHHASSGTVQPARTFPTSIDSGAKSKQSDLSRPVGCGGNPYYYNHSLKKWVFFDARGRQKVSPSQPPCEGAEVILQRDERKSGKNARQ